eukprot:13222570-Alexandrium_andersonii.AAC.1
MSASLVGSEMCIRDRASNVRIQPTDAACSTRGRRSKSLIGTLPVGWTLACLLYTSDAADDM